MSTQTILPRFATLKWISRKLVGLFVVYVAVGSVFQSIQADSILGTLLYLLLGISGIYLLVNW
ncbi:hypothetical protein [Halobacterium wangiae]|uniref:hypothetical protein n=1 Tax=Halobacterium wangiae TaxID=2902623 RepID=UPI001E57EEE5|nr:hypothetical protein [Halobacterium wangiae]